MIPFLKDLEFNLYCDICSCEGSSSARIIYLRAYQSVWDQVGVYGLGSFALRMVGILLFNDLKGKLEIFWFRTSRHEVFTSKEEILLDGKQKP